MGICLVQRGWHCTTAPSSCTAKQRATADTTWSGRHFSQTWAEMVPVTLLFASHLGCQQSPTHEEDRKNKDKIKALLPAEAKLQLPRGVCLQTTAEHLKKAILREHPGLGNGDWTGRRCPSDWASATPSPALSFSREEQSPLLGKLLSSKQLN